MIASAITTSSVWIVNISTWAPGTASSSLLVASMPDPPGMRMSIRTTSGVVSVATATAPSASWASPTTSTPFASRCSRSARRKSSWSSTIKTRMPDAKGCSGIAFLSRGLSGSGSPASMLAAAKLYSLNCGGQGPPRPNTRKRIRRNESWAKGCMRPGTP